jgi:hypothetical protein
MLPQHSKSIKLDEKNPYFLNKVLRPRSLTLACTATGLGRWQQLENQVAADFFG